MTDTNDIQVAKLQLTKEILGDLGIPSALVEANKNMPTQAVHLIDEYSKYFRQLWKVLNNPSEAKAKEIKIQHY